MNEKFSSCPVITHKQSPYVVCDCLSGLQQMLFEKCPIHEHTANPASVSLDDVTVAHCNKRRAQVGLRPATKDMLKDDLDWKNYRECVQCALDAAGVTYVP